MAGFLYIHVPFCIRKCLYCDFVSVPHAESLSMRYVDALCRELRLKKDIADSLKTVYIGGGTPSLLSPDSFRQLFGVLRDCFDSLDDAEITVETNPGTIDLKALENLLSLGVNRVSMGIQSFNDAELKVLGRIHTSEEARHAVELLRQTGLKNFSLDVMYGIPGQSETSWEKTLSEIIQLSPCHVSAYELTPEKHTPLYRMLEAGRITMPDEGLILAMSGIADNRLSGAGYDHYEISNYALEGYRSIHNLNYWDRGEYIGAGAGAHSFVSGVRSRNSGDVEEYIRLLTNGKSPEVEATTVSPSEAAREFLFLGLRKTEGIHLSRPELQGLDLAAALYNDDDLMPYSVILGDHFSFNKKGMAISNTLIVRLLDRLGL